MELNAVICKIKLELPTDDNIMKVVKNFNCNVKK